MKYTISVIVFALVFFILLPACGEKKDEKAGDRLPEIVPYLDAVPSAADGRGKVEVNPKGPFPAGSWADFQITFTIGTAGIAPGGFVILQISPWWGWSRPQDSYPDGEGFITVTPSFDKTFLHVKILPMHRVLVFSQKQQTQGETITFTYSHARVDRFAEAGQPFLVFVDADGDGHSACIAEPPVIRTTAREPIRLAVHSPPQAVPGEKIGISTAPLDGQGNWSRFPAGTFTLTVTEEKAEGKKSPATTVKTTGNEKTVTFDYSLPGEGIYFFHVKGPGGLTGKSNVTLCREGTPALNLYFGDIHGHSGISDGTGTPDDYYRFARGVSGLDIAALTDHVDHGLIRVKGKVWEKIKKVANEAYAPGRFVTFVGFEWTNWHFGHRNVYYRDGDGPVFRSIDEESNRPEKLWDLLAPYEAMTVAHHVGGGPVAVDWTIPPGRKEWLVEICSIHGSSEYYGCEAGIYRPKEGHFVRDALSRGYKLGIFGSGDTHDGHPGRRTVNAPVTGLMGVYAPELTREAVWEAFRNRRVYGTSGPKIILNFRVCDSPMGSEVKWPKSKGPVPIALRTVCCDAIERIEIIRNGEPVFVKGAETFDGVFALLLIEDPEPPAGASWYYARVLQKDGNMAWSSPVWVSL